MAALYRDVFREEPSPKNVDVLMHKLRKKLKPYGIKIDTIHAYGWRLPPEGKQKITAMVRSQGSTHGTFSGAFTGVEAGDIVPNPIGDDGPEAPGEADAAQ